MGCIPEVQNGAADDGASTGDVQRAGEGADTEAGTYTAAEAGAAGGTGAGAGGSGAAGGSGGGAGAAGGSGGGTGKAVFCSVSAGLPSATASARSAGTCTFCFSYLAKPWPHPSRAFFLGASSSAP